MLAFIKMLIYLWSQTSWDQDIWLEWSSLRVSFVIEFSWEWVYLCVYNGQYVSWNCLVIPSDDWSQVHCASFLLINRNTKCLSNREILTKWLSIHWFVVCTPSSDVQISAINALIHIIFTCSLFLFAFHCWSSRVANQFSEVLFV